MTSFEQTAGSSPTGDRRPVAVALLAGTAGGLAVLNLIVLLVGRGAASDGTLVLLQDGADPHEIEVASVLFMSVVPLLLGTGLALLLSRWWPPVLVLAQVIGGAAGVLTALGPLSSDSDDATRFSLAVMHTLAGVAVVAGLQLLRSRRDDSTLTRA